MVTLTLKVGFVCVPGRPVCSRRWRGACWHGACPSSPKLPASYSSARTCAGTRSSPSPDPTRVPERACVCKVCVHVCSILCVRMFVLLYHVRFHRHVAEDPEAGVAANAPQVRLRHLDGIRGVAPPKGGAPVEGGLTEHSVTHVLAVVVVEAPRPFLECFSLV